MGRDATLYWKSRATGRIGEEEVGRACYLEVYKDGGFYCYAGRFDGHGSRQEWVDYKVLCKNLSRVALASGGEYATAIEEVLKVARPRAARCDFCIVAEESTPPKEVEIYQQDCENKDLARRKLSQRKQSRRNASTYRQVKRELAEKIKNQWR